MLLTTCSFAIEVRLITEKSHRIGYASSTDLINWIRDDSKAGIDISTEKNAFDNEMLAYPHVLKWMKKPICYT